MHLFTFEPGDGTSYRVLFGRLPAATPRIPHYLVFGFGEFGDALITLVFDTDRISYDAFIRRWQTARHTSTVNEAAYLRLAAWVVFAALSGQSYVLPPKLWLCGWRDDWRARLPVAALG